MTLTDNLRTKDYELLHNDWVDHGYDDPLKIFAGRSLVYFVTFQDTAT